MHKELFLNVLPKYLNGIFNRMFCAIFVLYSGKMYKSIQVKQADTPIFAIAVL